MLVIGLVVVAAVLLMSRSASAQTAPPQVPPKAPDTKSPSNAGVGADPGNVSNTMKDVMSGIGAGMSVATAGLAIAKGVAGLVGGGAGGAAGSGAAGGAAGGAGAAGGGSAGGTGGASAGAGIGAGLAAAAPGLIAWAVVITIGVIVFAVVSIQHASQTLNMVLQKGKAGCVDRFRFMVWQLESEIAKGLIEALGGHIQTQDFRGPTNQNYGNQQTWVVTSITGLTPEMIDRIAVVSRVMAMEQARGHNVACMRFFTSQYGETANSVESKGFALDDQSWVAFVAMYYSQNHTVPYGGYLGAGWASNYVQAHSEGPVIAKRLLQAIFAGQCSATKYVKLVQGQFAPYNSDDTAAANAADPKGTPLTAHFNFAYFNGALRQSGNHLINDNAMMAFDHVSDTTILLPGA